MPDFILHGKRIAAVRDALRARGYDVSDDDAAKALTAADRIIPADQATADQLLAMSERSRRSAEGN